MTLCFVMWRVICVLYCSVEKGSLCLENLKKVLSHWCKDQNERNCLVITKHLLYLMVVN